MTYESKHDSIEKVKSRLYSRTPPPDMHTMRHALHDIPHEVRESWQEDSDGPHHILVPYTKRSNFLPTLFTISVFFFLLATTISIFLILGGRNLVSSENIDITILGPVALAGGEELELQLSVVNRNAVPIQTTDLIVEYPSGTRSANNVAVELPRHRESLGVIAPGEEVRRTVRAVLFGDEGETQNIPVTVEYRVEGSNAIFYTETVHNVVLSSSPLAVSVEGLEEVTSGQEVEFTVTVRSNSESRIDDVLMVATYPFGFSIKDTSPRSAYDNSVFALGSFETGDTKTVVIRGTVVGVESDERVFRFETGTRNPENDRTLAAVFGKDEIVVDVRRAFITILPTINGNVNSTVSVSPGQDVTFSLQWENTLAVPIFDAEISVAIEGSFDERTVKGEGYYDSITNTIRFTRDTVPALSNIEPGATGSVSFKVSPLPQITGEAGRNPTITFTSDVKGRRLNESRVPEILETTLTRMAQITSAVTFEGETRYEGGTINNFGPFPPRAEQETAYSIVWRLTNMVNDVGNIKVTATLPSYVKWMDVTSPPGAEISYNPELRLVTWYVANLPARASGGSGIVETEFQIAITPSLSQIGTKPILLLSPKMVGTDRFTKVQLSGSIENQTTEVWDPNAPKDHEKVWP